MHEARSDIGEKTSTSGSVMVTPHSDMRSEGNHPASNECTDKIDSKLR